MTLFECIPFFAMCFVLLVLTLFGMLCCYMSEHKKFKVVAICGEDNGISSWKKTYKQEVLWKFLSVRIAKQYVKQLKHVKFVYVEDESLKYCGNGGKTFNKYLNRTHIWEWTRK